MPDALVTSSNSAGPGGAMFLSSTRLCTSSLFRSAATWPRSLLGSAKSSRLNDDQATPAIPAQNKIPPIARPARPRLNGCEIGGAVSTRWASSVPRVSLMALCPWAHLKAAEQPTFQTLQLPVTWQQYTAGRHLFARGLHGHNPLKKRVL